MALSERAKERRAATRRAIRETESAHRVAAASERGASLDGLTHSELLRVWTIVYRKAKGEKAWPEDWEWVSAKRNKASARKWIREAWDLIEFQEKVAANGGKVYLPHFAEMMRRVGL